ncbi:hypothetical protein ACFUEM_32820 [Streptomyces anulatus]|uniref:hypothetical protein n=1 Tax=Streptomyces anulatus TaxID=1892 RepID=UPI0035E1A3EF
MASEEDLFASADAEQEPHNEVGDVLGGWEGLDTDEDPGEARAGGSTRAKRSPAERLRVEAQANLLVAAERLVRLSGLAAGSAHSAGFRCAGQVSELLPTHREALTRAGEITVLAQQEVLLGQSGTGWFDLDASVGLLGESAESVETKSLYDASAYDHLMDQGRADGLVGRGVQVSLSGTRFPRMIIVDSQHLLIDAAATASTSSGAQWHITDPGTIGWAREVFLMLWGNSTRWQDLRQASGHATTNERQRRILRALEAGGAQNDIGSHTGMKQRTVEREMLSLRSKLGGWNMYQVMAWWGRSSERKLL